jgi:hypothetical protein
VLERLGTPREIVTEQLERLGLPARRAGGQEWAAIVLLLVGGFLFAVGWLVGLVLLWSSRAWTKTEKLIGTLVIPGGLFGGITIPLFTTVGGSSESCVSRPAVTGIERHGGKTHLIAVHPAMLRCTGGASTLHTVLYAALFIALLAAPMGTAIFLARRARAAPA